MCLCCEWVICPKIGFETLLGVGRLQLASMEMLTEGNPCAI